MIGALDLVKMSPTTPRRMEYHPDSPESEAKSTAEVATQTDQDQESDFTFLRKESNQRMETIVRFSKSYDTLTQLVRNLVQQQQEADRSRLKRKGEDQPRRPKEEEVTQRYYDKWNTSWKSPHPYYQSQPRRRYSPNPTDEGRPRGPRSSRVYMDHYYNKR